MGDEVTLSDRYETASQAIRRYRQKKRKEGLCGYNGCKELSATYLCPDHRLAAAIASARYRETCRIG